MENDSQTKNDPSQESESGNPGEDETRSPEPGPEGPESGSSESGGELEQAGAPKAEAELEVILAKQSLELSKTISMLKEAISGRSEAVKLARASQERFGQLCEITNDLVYTHDFSGKITSFNLAAEKITGYTREEALQMNIADLIAPSHRELIPLMMDPARAEGRTMSYRLELVAKGGREIPVRIRPRFIYWEGSPVGILGAASLSPEGETDRGIKRHPSAEHVIRLEEETAELSRVNVMLREQIAAHERAEELLRKTLADLQTQLEEKSAELSKAGEAVREEISRRDMTDEERARIRAELEQRLEEQSAKLARVNALLMEQSALRKHAEENLKGAVEEAEARLEDEIARVLTVNEKLKDQLVENERTQESLRKSISDLQGQLSERSEELSQARALIQAEVAALKSAEGVIGEAGTEVAPVMREPAMFARELMVLGDMGNLLRACTTLEEAYRVVSRTAPGLFSNLSGGLYVISPSSNTLSAVATWGRVMPEERAFAPADCWALRTGRIHWVEDTRTGLICKHLPSPLPDNRVCIPMLDCGEILALLHLWRTQKGEITISTIRLAATVAELVAMAMSHLKQAGSTASQAVGDPLTGLFNRRFMEDALELELHRCAQNHGTVAIIMLDIDKLSFFNESFGQDVGDQLL